MVRLEGGLVFHTDHPELYISKAGKTVIKDPHGILDTRFKNWALGFNRPMLSCLFRETKRYGIWDVEFKV